MKKMLKWLWARLSGVRLMLVGAYAIGCLRIVVSLSFVWVSKTLIDLATQTPRADEHSLWTCAGVLAALMLTEMLMSIANTYMCSKAEIKFKNSLREYLYRHVLGADYQQATSRHSGEMLNRLLEDTRFLSDALCRNLPDVMVMVMQLLGAFAFLYYMSPMLALAIVGIMPVCVAISKIYMVRMRRITAALRDCDGSIQTTMQEGVQHLVLVKAMRWVSSMSAILGVQQEKLYGVTVERIRFSLFSRAMVRIGFILGYLSAFLWGVWHLYVGAISFGTMTAFLQLVARIQNPMANLSRYVPSLVQATTSADRLMALDDMPLEPKAEDVYLPAPAGIRVDGVTFKYPDADKCIFKDFSFDFQPGKITAIVGVTGIGKTTLIRMIMALLYPQAGTISIYNADTSQPVTAATRCNLSYVPQGNSLICDTVRANLLMDQSERDDTELRQALHIADAEFVYDLPNGLDTICGERGARLSEGQAQRIAIARAILCRGSILLLDEFNSALDATTASRIMQRLTELSPKRTIIMITHRRDTLAYCHATLSLS